jgi:hypothetical protein
MKFNLIETQAWDMQRFHEEKKRTVAKKKEMTGNCTKIRLNRQNEMK